MDRRYLHNYKETESTSTLYSSTSTSAADTLNTDVQHFHRELQRPIQLTIDKSKIRPKQDIPIRMGDLNSKIVKGKVENIIAEQRCGMEEMED